MPDRIIASLGHSESLGLPLVIAKVVGMRCSIPHHKKGKCTKRQKCSLLLHCVLAPIGSRGLRLQGRTIGLDREEKSDKKAVLSQANRACDAAAVVFGLKFADNIHYKFKSSQASKARLHAPKVPAQNRI